MQRFDSALRLNVHAHTLAVDGVYLRADDGELVFHALGEPSRDEVAEVAPGAFTPPPEVSSAVVVLTPSRRAEETVAFRRVVKSAFSTRRKTLRNAWRALGSREALERAPPKPASISMPAPRRSRSRTSMAAALEAQ